MDYKNKNLHSNIINTGVTQTLPYSESDRKFALEQYKLLVGVLVGLADNLVKSFLTIFIIFSSILALIVNRIDSSPNMYYLLYVNYALIAVFLYYMSYLRFRIKVQMSFIEEIEITANFPYKSLFNYKSRTTKKFLSTKGVFILIVLVLLGANTAFLIFLP